MSATKLILVFGRVFFILNAFAQENLVPNPSFEDSIRCTDGIPPIDNSIVGWFQPSLGTTDYFQTCALFPFVQVPDNFWGYQYPHSGEAYIGLFTNIVYYDSVWNNYREYIEIELSAALESGKEYFVSFHVSLADSSNYATDAIGAYLSTDTARSDTSYQLVFTPQVANKQGNFLIDKKEWVQIFGKFIASGGERFLTIGNFKSRLNTDTISVTGGSNNTGQSDYLGGYYFIDDVCVSSDSLYATTWTGNPSHYPIPNIEIYPNPANVLLTLSADHPRITYALLNSIGKVVKRGICNASKKQINVSKLPNGLYFLVINNKHVYKTIIHH